jgi:tripartite-type tricarboxylate transporter receptor subunit TctC
MKGKGIMRGIKLLVLGLLLSVVPALAFAQDYPTKSVTITTTFGPGTPIDLANRVLASKVEKTLGQPFIINNNPTGAGMVAVTQVAKENADGYHLLFTTTTTLLWVPQFRKVNVKYEDFDPIMQFGTPAVGLVVRADAPYKTLKELAEYAKKNPGKVSYGATGKGTPKQVVMDAIAKKEGIEWTFIPYDADNLSLAALLGGHIDVCSASPVWISHVQQGRLRLLATYCEDRMKAFPDVPTVKELGYNFMDPAVYLLVGPKGIPPLIVKKLDDTFHKAMDDPEFKKVMGESNYEIVYRGSSDLKRFMEKLYKEIGEMKADLNL